MSAAMAVATKSRYFKYEVEGSSNISAKAIISLKPTPHPHNSLNGYGQSFCLGFNMATAGGNSASGKWWSHTIKSISNILAYSIRSMDLIPQSNEIINVMPLLFA